MRIVLAGSGSGGHFYPLIAIAEALRTQAEVEQRPAPELYLMGPSPYDAGALYSNGITFVPIPAGKVRRYFSLRNLLDFFKTIGGFFVALTRLFILYPDVVMTKGSYTSVPVVLAAFILRIPVVVHESDLGLGRANKLAARFARIVTVSYEATLTKFPNSKKMLRTGVPVRRHLLPPYTGEAYAALGIPKDLPLIVVLGGSQGAERVNNLIVSALDELLPKYRILHQTGEQHAEITQKSAEALVRTRDLLDRYHVKGFLSQDEMAAAYAAASLVICRAGSGTIYEVALHGIPSILIPIPEHIVHDQRDNAYEYARTGAASVIEEKNLSPHLLAATIERIMGDDAQVHAMRTAAQTFAPTDAADTIAKVLTKISDEHG